MARTLLDDSRVNVRIKLALLWASIMFCFIYADYFELYTPYRLSSMLAGKIVPLGPVTQAKLLGTSIMMVIPSLMSALAVILRPPLAKWLNIAIPLIFVVITVLVIQGSWHFYVFFGIVEILLLLTVVWHAWKWPRLDA